MLTLVRKEDSVLVVSLLRITTAFSQSFIKSGSDSKQDKFAPLSTIFTKPSALTFICPLFKTPSTKYVPSDCIIADCPETLTAVVSQFSSEIKDSLQ